MFLKENYIRCNDEKQTYARSQKNTSQSKIAFRILQPDTIEKGEENLSQRRNKINSTENNLYKLTQLSNLFKIIHKVIVNSKCQQPHNVKAEKV